MHKIKMEIFKLVLYILFIGKVASIEWKRREAHFYHISENKLNHKSARQTCLDLNADLASVLSLKEMNFLKTYLNTEKKVYWIGLYTDSPCNSCSTNQNSSACQSCRRNWHWLDREPFVFSSWGPMNPNNNFKCGALGWIPSSYFIDEPCEAQHYFICKARGICMTSPCINGLCKPLASPANYTCICNIGYRGPHCELDVNECIDRTLCAYGTCHNTNGSYVCQCEDGTERAHCFREYFGPVAGSTPLSLTLQYFNDKQLTNVVMKPRCGDNCPQYKPIVYTSDMLNRSSNGSSIVFLTLPSVEYGFNALPNQTDTLLYQITLEAGTDKHFAGYFVYRPNPVIGDIASGGISIASGGIQIKIEGDNLNSVMEPELFVYQETKMGNEIQSVKKYSSTMTECNRTMMIFKTPPVNETRIHISQSNNSSRPQQSVQEKSNSEIHVSYYLGFGFDGFGDYENYSETNPEAAMLTMLPEPRFESFAANEVMQFDPRKETVLHFKGKDLSYVDMDNYMVSIGTGKGNCKVIRVDDNKLTCQPPKMEPGVNHSLTHKHGMPTIHIFCGYASYFIGHIDYYERNMYVPIGIVMSCVLAIAIASGIFVRMKRRRASFTITPNAQQEYKGHEMFVLEECDENTIDEMLPKII